MSQTWNFTVTCSKCKHQQVFPVDGTWKAFGASINIIAGLKTVADISRLVTIHWDNYCQCPADVKLTISLPSWYKEALQKYKSSLEDYRKSHPL